MDKSKLKSRKDWSHTSTEFYLRYIAEGFCELIDEQKRMNRLLASIMRTQQHDEWTAKFIDEVIKECYGDPDQIFKENVLGIKEDKDDKNN